MRSSDDLPVALARLVALGQAPDVNIRPVLLRVVVDLFTSKSHHAPPDLQQFEAIVAHLLDDAPVEARILVAEKLSKHPATPKGLLGRLIAEQSAVAVQVYRNAALPRETLLSAATWSAAEVAEAVAGRSDLSADIVSALVARSEPRVARALAANASVVVDRPAFQQLVKRARQDPDLAALLVDRQSDPIDLAPLFPLVPPEQRQAIIDAARRLELGRRQWGRIDGATAKTLAHLDRLILSGERDGFETALGLAVGIDSATMHALLNDDGGEILALALAAAGASADMAARAFILGDARIGHSITRVRALTAIVATVSQHAARRLMTAMTSDGAATPRRAKPPTPGRLASPARRSEAMAAETAPVRRDAPVVPARRLG